MNDLRDVDLSSLARERQQEMLPGLLTAVKRRRHRRQAVRAVAAVLVVGAVGFLAQSMWGRAAVAPPPVEPVAASWTAFANDPTAVTRCVVATVRRSEWFVDDDGLNELLQQAGRRTGIIRAGGTIAVNREAIDEWPAADEESE